MSECAPPAVPLARPGAYGLHLPDLAAASDLLMEAPPSWPAWGVEVAVDSVDELERNTPAQEVLDGRRAVLRLAGGGWMVADRDARRTTLHLDHRANARAIVHPYFSLSAAVAAHWDDALALHAAAVVLHGQAWAFLGDKGAGKSSTIAALARTGAAVLTDDVLVLRDGHVLAGPRTIDLREDVGVRTPDAEAIGRVGARDRWRLVAEPAPCAVPFGGVFVLRWGDALAVEIVDAPAKFSILLRNLSLRVPPMALGELHRAHTVPMLALTRPRRREELDASVEAVLAAADAHG